MQFHVHEQDAGQRLDQVLAARIPELSRRRARVLLDIGGVFVDRARVKVASRKVRAGQLVEAHLGGALERATMGVGRAARALDARALPAHQVVFEDEHIVVVDKPAGLLTAPTPESDRNNLLDLLRGDGQRSQVLLVHRIDLHTSGLLVFAKTAHANEALAARFRAHDVIRAYLAVVHGALARDEVSVRVPVKGRRAVTHLAALARISTAAATPAAAAQAAAAQATLVRARLETGRTHQIRIHCRHIGHPVLGDRQYGRRTSWDPPRMALHAETLGFVHPASGELLTFTSPVPGDLAPWLAELQRTPAGVSALAGLQHPPAGVSALAGPGDGASPGDDV